ncbi:UNVERIFIED_CONTAM: WD repeat-containing protein WDS [Sesamum radiatum]|uniref:WD repeat-containing protein WDS n=1 Tax=Sesamum radiatum TaxID=300843 RepID=A0AAW2W7S2_SESRA
MEIPGLDHHFFDRHKNPVSFVAWSPDDTMLLTCGNMEVLKLWDVETGTCKHTFINDGFVVSSCAWFPDSKRLVCGSSDPKKGIYMWDCEGNEIKAWKGMRMPKVLDLAVTDGEISSVYIWNRRSSNPIEVLSGHLMTVNCVSWNPRRPEMLASASDDNTIRIWGPSRSK